jgi:hypothetical protein
MQRVTSKHSWWLGGWLRGSRHLSACHLLLNLPPSSVCIDLTRAVWLVLDTLAGEKVQVREGVSL